jgi:branched-chain amino acid transport system ATP-binding protein
LLTVNNIEIFYGKIQALFDVSLTVGNQEIVSIIGANGAGKSTLMKSISGLIHPSSGSIIFDGVEITKTQPHKIVERGIIQVPEGRLVFPRMTVLENLEMGGYTCNYKKKAFEAELEKIHVLFPRLKEREKQMAGTLSGGEQQMLAIARGLMAKPKLLMLDEPSLGLAPLLVDEVFDVIKNINEELHVPILLVEQNAFSAMSISNRTYVLEVGHVNNEGLSAELIKSPAVIKTYLGGI